MLLHETYFEFVCRIWSGKWVASWFCLAYLTNRQHAVTLQEDGMGVLHAVRQVCMQSVTLYRIGPPGLGTAYWSGQEKTAGQWTCWLLPISDY